MLPGGMPRQAWAPSTPTLDELHSDFSRLALPELHSLARRHKGPPSLAVLRVAQLDAGRLDVELASMLQEQLRKAFSLFRPELISALEPELKLLLDLLIFSCSVWVGRPAPGAALMNLRYRNERGLSTASAGLQQQEQASRAAAPLVQGALADVETRKRYKTLDHHAVQSGGRTGVEGPGLTRTQRVAYGLLILVRYAWGRAGTIVAQQADRAPPGTWAPRAWQIMRRTEAAEKIVSVVNMLVFLRRGVYRSISERLLCARLVLQQASMARALSFEYLNRQLVWQELSELLLFLLPLLNVTQLRRGLLKYLPRITGTGVPTPGGEVGGASDTANQTCGVCSSGMMPQPYAAEPCGHLFCYYCLRSRTEADKQFVCPLCHMRVSAMKPASRPVSMSSVIVQ